MASEQSFSKTQCFDFPQGLLAHNSELLLKEAFDTLLSISHHADKGCIRPEELAHSLTQSALKKFTLKAYDGFEPSGRMHIAQGLMKTINVNKMTRCGVSFVFLVADWFAHLNNKFGGDLKKIRLVGQYFIEVWKACGMDLSSVQFLWSSAEINKDAEKYWTLVMDIARKNSVSRVKRCGQIMGRVSSDTPLSSLLSLIHSNRENDSALTSAQFVEKYSTLLSDPQPVAQLLYPLMQCADIFFLEANICQLGMDQLKVNMLAREYCVPAKSEKRSKVRKPIILSHPMLMGLKEGQAKMSKSDPNSAIFMEDSREEVQRKIRKGFCRPGDVEENPILDYLEKIVFAWHCDEKDYRFVVERTEENGGTVEFSEFEEVKEAFSGSKLHPNDLKKGVAREINELLEPVRRHFIENAEAKQLLKRVRSIKT